MSIDPADPRVVAAERIYAAFAAADVEAALAHLHPNIVFDWSRSRAPYRGIYQGPEAVREIIETNREAWTDLEYFTEELIEVGERIVRVGGFRARGRSSGLPWEAVGAQVIEYRDGLISRVTLYQTKEEALAAAGAS